MQEITEIQAELYEPFDKVSFGYVKMNLTAVREKNITIGLTD